MEQQKLQELDKIADKVYRQVSPHITQDIEDYVSTLKSLPEQALKSRLNKQYKTPLPSPTALKLWQYIHEGFVIACLLGMNHIYENIYFADYQYQGISFEEAIQFLSSRVPLTRQEFYSLEAGLRLRSFTVARLTELDYINRVRLVLKNSLSKGYTLSKFWDEMKHDYLLQVSGFEQSNPWYWETVFRTNLQTAYNAGRKIQIAKNPNIKYLQFIGINDKRQTSICKCRNNIILPATHKFWERNTPPLHFNCRSTLRPIYQSEADLKNYKSSDITEIDINPQKGFGLDPVKALKEFKLPGRLYDRAAKYDVLSEIKKLSLHLQQWLDTIQESTAPLSLEALTEWINDNFDIAKLSKTDALNSSLWTACVVKFPNSQELWLSTYPFAYFRNSNYKDELFAILKKIATKKSFTELTYNEEAILSVLWHEILHMNQPSIMTSSEEEKIFWETVHELRARLGFQRFLDRFRLHSRHHSRLIKNAIGYQNHVTKLQFIFDTLKIDPNWLLRPLDPTADAQFFTIQTMENHLTTLGYIDDNTKTEARHMLLDVASDLSPQGFEEKWKDWLQNRLQIKLAIDKDRTSAK